MNARRSHDSTKHFHTSKRCALGLALALLLSTAHARALDDETVATTVVATSATTTEDWVEHYSNGQLKASGSRDAGGRLHGEYSEYYIDGTLKVQTKYKRALLNGKYESFHPDGSESVTASYKNGLLNGKYHEVRVNGVRNLQGAYKKGKRDGKFLIKDRRETIRVQLWSKGSLLSLDEIEVYPRTPTEVWDVLAEVYNPLVARGGKGLGLTDAPSQKKVEDEPAIVNDRDAALRRLMAHRYLAGVAWEDVIVSARFNYHAAMAAKLMFETGKLSSKPDNPGWLRKDYQHAKMGAMSCVYQRADDLRTALEQTIAELGNTGVGWRTYLLDPRFMTTGFGHVGNVNLIWRQDESRSSPADYDWIGLPARGVMPVDHFGKQHAWSLTLNPGNHAPIQFKKDVSVRVYRLDEDWVHVDDPLELEFINIFDRTISFRPMAYELVAGARYEVQIPGIRHDKVGSTLTYFVEFAEAPTR